MIGVGSGCSPAWREAAVEIRGATTARSLSALTISVLLVVTAGPAAAAPPTNDNFATRTTIPAVPFTEVLSTAEATTEPGESDPACGPIGKTVWYQYTPPADVVLGASTLGSDFDTLLGVWTGTSFGSLSPVTCADTLHTVFEARAGTTYLIQVGGWAGEAGTLSFRLREVDAGVISGTVTDSDTGGPLNRICVEISDADFDVFFFESTNPAGEYRVPVRPGAYLVFFSDQCDQSNDHRSEWYQDASTLEQADEVVVLGPGEVPNIDAALEPSCPGFGDTLRDQVIGTQGPDHLVGGPQAEVFCGFGGADRINGNGGSDWLFSDEGRDRLSGGEGADFLSGGDGGDRLQGGDTRDRLFGDAGDDGLSGGGGNDYMEGELGSDRLLGGGDDDKLKGSRGDDALSGGPGKDLCDGFKGDDLFAPSCEQTRDGPRQ
jgi:RTX calcium-binding nonapeptide repeat (4 copies)